MTTIFTATNFSDAANEAVNYACQLAEQQGASVVVFHSYMVPITTAYGDTSVPIPTIPIEEASQIAEENMANFMQQLRQEYPTLSLSHKILYGDIIDGLIEYTEEHHKPSLIVLGNSGDADFWLGSNLLNGLRHLPYPTLAIPANTSYHAVRKICYACDYKNESLAAIPQLLALQKTLNAALHILNINHDAKINGDKVEETQELLASGAPVYHFVDNTNTDEAIQSFITNNSMDWLVVIPHKHSFFEGLFHKSHTRAMVQTIHIPLLALHEK